MARILFWLLLGVLAYVAYRWWRQSIARADARAQRGAERGAEGESTPENIVQCEVCGLNLPQSEALPLRVQEPTRWYCSEAHRQQAGK